MHLALGGDTTLASRQGEVLSWGRDDWGQTAAVAHDDCAGTPCDHLPTHGAPQDARLLAEGGAHACATDASDRLLCWGRNAFGELALGVADPDSHSVPALTLVSAVSELALGRFHGCAISAGAVSCWGLGAHGEMGVPAGDLDPCVVPAELAAEAGLVGVSVAACAREPVRVPLPADAVELVAGDFHTCARLADGTVACWGSNALGQLGTGSNEASRPPSPLALAGVTRLAAGAAQTCALDAARRARCWGAATDGRLATGSAALDDCEGTACLRSPTANAYLTDVDDVALGEAHGCALSHGKVTCWGSDQLEQLGNSEQAVDACTSGPCTRVPVEPYGLPAVRALAAGRAHNCVVVADQVWCWGDARFGQTGHYAAHVTSPALVYAHWSR